MQLGNDMIQVELDPHTGGIVSIVNKQRGYQYILAPERALLLRLMVPEDERQGNYIDAAEPEIEICGDTATLTYRIGAISATATLTLDGGAIMANLHLTNAGPSNIEEIMFPWVRGVGPIPDGHLVMPNFWKRKYDDVFGKDLGGDHRTWNEWTQKFSSRYPAYMATAWCDYGNSDHGIAVEGRHTDFSIMDFFVHKIVDKTREPVQRTLDFVTVHPRRVRQGETYTSSPVRITVHEGDWHVVADAHREWVETWITKPDRPAKFAESIGWHFYFMKHQDGYVPHTYDDLVPMAQAALDAGCPYLLLFGWQVGGHDNNYFYRYVPNDAWGGEAALKEAVRRCREMGVEIMPFFNGTLANTELAEHKEFGHRWEAKTRTGHPYYAGDWARHNFDAPTRNRAMLHTEIAFCAEQRAYFLATVKRIVQDYGFGNTQLDQMAEKMLVDYNEDHVTTTPDRVYVDGVAQLLPEVRRLIREVNPEGVMISEAINEYTGQWCDSSWDWNILLPFPEPILYSLPWLMASHEIDALEYGEVNKAFAYKMHFDMKIDGGDTPITKYPKFAEHVRRLAELRRRTAPYYVHADFRDQEGIETTAPDSVIVKTYRKKAANTMGIVIAETSGEKTEVQLKAQGHFESYSTTGDEGSVNLAGGATIPMDAFEVRVLCGR